MKHKERTLKNAVRQAEQAMSRLLDRKVIISELQLGEVNKTVGDWKFELISDVITRECEKDILVRRRGRDRVDGRRIACVILVREHRYTAVLTGELLGGYDHSTVLHHLQVHDDLITTDRKYQELFNRVSNAVEKALKQYQYENTGSNQTLRRTEDGDLQLRSPWHASAATHGTTRPNARCFNRILNEDQESFIKSITYEQIN